MMTSYIKVKDRNYILKALFFMLIITVFLSCSTVTVHASPKLSKKKITLMSGKIRKIKLKGTKGVVEWSSSNKNVATVSGKKSTVKITATGAGKAKVTAKYNGKKYTVTVIVNGIKNPGNVQTGKSFKLKTTKLGKNIKWSSNASNVASVDKKTGQITTRNPGKVKITAKGSKGKAFITLVVGTVPGSSDAQGGSSGSSGGSSGGSSSDESTSDGSGSSTTPPTPSTPSYPVISTKTSKYHYEIVVLNDKTVDGHDNRIYNMTADGEDCESYEQKQCALLYIKTDAPYNGSGSSSGSFGKMPFTFLIDGKYYPDQYKFSSQIGNAHYNSNGRPVGGEFVKIFAMTPGVHTIEIVEDLDYSWDGSQAKNVLKSYSKIGVSIKIRYYDYLAEKTSFINDVVSRYTSSGMTDRQKAEALRSFMLSDHFHHVPVIYNGSDYVNSNPISFISFTPFWISGCGDCRESNGLYILLLKKAGVQCKLMGSGSHVYATCYLDNEWVNMDVAKSNYPLQYNSLLYVN